MLQLHDYVTSMTWQLKSAKYVSDKLAIANQTCLTGAQDLTAHGDIGIWSNLPTGSAVRVTFRPGSLAAPVEK